jgi:hypothetical protein
LFGLLPLASRPAQRLLQQVRPWIEPAQSFEKNQLGLSQMFFNSLRLAWQMSLWADSAVLLRTMAWLDSPAEIHLLAPLIARQMELGLDDAKKPASLVKPKNHPLTFGTPSKSQRLKVEALHKRMCFEKSRSGASLR